MLELGAYAEFVAGSGGPWSPLPKPDAGGDHARGRARAVTAHPFDAGRGDAASNGLGRSPS
jgi:hypothetical protein